MGGGTKSNKTARGKPKKKCAIQQKKLQDFTRINKGRLEFMGK